jgi:imidazolonepropionase
MKTAMNVALWHHARLATLAGESGWGLIEDGAIVTEGDTLRWVGPAADLPADLRVDAKHDLGGALVTPGLVDAHTHLVYGGDRSREFEMRLQGASYEAIASDEALLAGAVQRGRALCDEGLTTLEIKSGYGLDAHHEARCLRIAREVGEALGITVRTTCLSAHALPPEFEGRPDEYISAVCAWLPELHAQGLIDAVDAFCENIAFTPEQTRRVFDAARALGLPVKLHAEQLSNQGGARLAAGYGALSCDHLEHLDAGGIAAMAQAGSVAVLLPGAFHVLRETRLPPVQALRNAGVPIAVATDHNPGTSPVLSPLLMISMACTLFRLTPEEALRGMTVNGARALGLHDRGQLAPGQRADFAAWPIAHPAELAYWLGRPMQPRVVVGGRERQRSGVDA